MMMIFVEEASEEGEEEEVQIICESMKNHFWKFQKAAVDIISS